MKKLNDFKIEELEQRLEMRKWADMNKDLSSLDDEGVPTDLKGLGEYCETHDC